MESEAKQEERERVNEWTAFVNWIGRKVNRIFYRMMSTYLMAVKSLNVCISEPLKVFDEISFIDKYKFIHFLLRKC